MTLLDSKKTVQFGNCPIFLALDSSRLNPIRLCEKRAVKSLSKSGRWGTMRTERCPLNY